ncbi:putative disease resistance RPP13-like protein 1-like [Capsicum annuum]|nr:putative disease resistance RPP13-like protein 1-like [Capsicum annuum]
MLSPVLDSRNSIQSSTPTAIGNGDAILKPHSPVRSEQATALVSVAAVGGVVFVCEVARDGYGWREMAEIACAVGGAFLNVLFERLASRVELLKMFQKNKHDDDGPLEKLGNTLVGLQIVLSDAENKQASDQHVRQWLNKLQSAVYSAENLMEEVHYEALKLKVEGQHQNLAETCNKKVFRFFSDCCGRRLSDDFFLNIKEKLEDTSKILEELEKQIGHLGLQRYFDSGKKLETRPPSTSVVESDVFGRQNEIEELIDRLMSKEASEKNLIVLPIVGMGGIGKTTLAKAVYNDEKVKGHFGLKAWICVSEPYDAFRISKGLLQEIGSLEPKDDNNLNQMQVKLKERLNGKRFQVSNCSG